MSYTQDTNYTFFATPTPLLENADAIVRLDKMEVTIEARDKMKVTSRRIVTVLNKDGNRHVHGYLGYEKNDKVNTLEAIVYNGNGNEITTFKKKDFLDVSAVSGGTLYSDSRVMYFQYTPISYPYTVEVIKEYTTPNTAFLPRWSFVDGYGVSTEKSEFSIQFYEGSSFRKKETNFDGYAITLEETPNTLHYTGEQIAAIKYEQMSPNFYDIVPVVKVALEEFHLEGVNGSAKTWKDLGQWMYNDLIKSQGAIPPATIEKVKGLVANLSTPEEKIKAVYQYVQSNTRYISVQLGIGGWMPISASEVDKVKYGDCKGLTNYTMALLKAVGIPSYYTVVYGGREIRDLDPEFPSMQGNHVFLNIPLENNEMWLECTSQLTPANFISEFTDNRMVLLVKPDGGEMVRSRVYSDEENYQLTTGAYTLKPNGDIAGEVEIVSQGSQYNRKYRLTVGLDADKEEHYKEYWDYVNNLTIKNIGLENDKDNIIFKENVQLEASHYATISGKDLIFAPNAFSRNTYVPDRYRSRKNAVLIERGFLDEDNFTIEIPKGYKVNTLFEQQEINNKFGSYSISIAKEGEQKLRIKRKWLIKEGTYAKEDYKGYRDFLRAVARYDAAKIIVTNNQP